MSSANRGPGPVPGRARELWHRLRAFHAAQVELQERALLRSSPWLEEYLHWSFDGEEWHLHGHLTPPSRGVCSVSRSGWCPGLRRP